MYAVASGSEVLTMCETYTEALMWALEQTNARVILPSRVCHGHGDRDRGDLHVYQTDKRPDATPLAVARFAARYRWPVLWYEPIDSGWRVAYKSNAGDAVVTVDRTGKIT